MITHRMHSNIKLKTVHVQLIKIKLMQLNNKLY